MKDDQLMRCKFGILPVVLMKPPAREWIYWRICADMSFTT